jgi:type III secretory pathway component EscR
MVKDSSIKLIAMLSKKVVLQKRIVKYQAIIEDIDEYVEDHLQSTKNIKDFQHIFDKLKTEYKNKLVDTSDEDEDNDDNDINNDDDNDNDNNDTKMELVKSKNDK